MRLAVDCAVFRWGEEGLRVLLVERRDEPFAGRWALPGGRFDARRYRDLASRPPGLELARQGFGSEG